MSPRVFAVQQPTERDGDRIVRSMDLSPAEEFGEVVFLLREFENPFRDPTDTARRIHEALDREDFDPENDWLLLVGNPILIALVAVAAADWAPRLRMLQWNRSQRAYLPVDVQLPELAV